MLNILLNLSTTQTSQACFQNVICANESFTSVYGVIFTIVISLGVYIYGLQNKSERITLIDNTNIKTVISMCLGFFAFSFFALPSPVYELLNFLLSAILLAFIFIAFRKVFQFNASELSGEKAVKEFKQSVIRTKLKEFEELKIKNDLLSSQISEKNPAIERFLLDENNETYKFIRANKSGFIANVDLQVLYTNKSTLGLNKKDNASIDGDEYYIPYSVSNGAPVDVDSIILGVKRKAEVEIDEDRLRSYISITSKYENPISYIEAETRSYYPEMIELIKIGDAKSLELKLKEFSGFVDNFTAKENSYFDIVQFINDDIVFPLQEYAFKTGNVTCIRKITSFSLGFIYRSLENKSVQTFNIFLRNLSYAFHQSLKLDSNSQKEFHEIYFRWIKELSVYSIKSRVKKDSSYTEYAVVLLSNLNMLLKAAFDKQDISLFETVLSSLNQSFVRENFEHGTQANIDEIILKKKAVLFGFTAWVYKFYTSRKGDAFYDTVLEQLISATSSDPVYDYRNNQDAFNYYISIYLQTAKLSEEKSSFGWDSWDMAEGVVYTITVREDIKRLLTDRVLATFAQNPNAPITINDGNYNDELAHIKQGDLSFDPLRDKSKSDFFATKNLTDDAFIAAKVKFYEFFEAVRVKYEADVRDRTIAQSLDQKKYDDFVRENFKSYKEHRILHRIQSFNHDQVSRNDGFGYNTLLPKEQFVAETNISYINQGQFGENLARTEDNKILEAIYKTLSDDVGDLSRELVNKKILSENDIRAVVFWVENYVDVAQIFNKNFLPSWQENNSNEKGPYYQGSINKIPVYVVYKFEEHKIYKDSVFFLKKDSFSVTEFAIADDVALDSDNTKQTSDIEQCLRLSLTDISNLNDVREQIVDNWIQKDPGSIINKRDRVEELKTDVLFKFHKGLDVASLEIKKINIDVFHVI